MKDPVQKRAGPPLTDLAVRMRNWFWYWSLRSQLPELGDSALDDRFIRPFRPLNAESPKYFERMRRAAWPPDEIPHGWNGHSLLEIVEADGSCPDLLREYKSPLWTMLSSKDIEPIWFTNQIDELLLRRGRPREFHVQSSMYGSSIEEEIFSPVSSPQDRYLKEVDLLKQETSLEGLFLLCAMFREAWLSFNLNALVPLANAAVDAAIRLCNQRSIPAVPKMLLRRLLLDRVLANRWVTQDEWMRLKAIHADSRRSFAKRVSELEAFVHWYVFHPHPQLPSLLKPL